MDVVFLDFKKDFDKVPHQRLLLKLKAHGIGKDVINWIEKSLTHRKQRVKVNGEISNWKSVLSGVPQGSVLGPILFLIYINDLEDDIPSNVLKFADDTKVFRKVTNDTDKQSLQDDLDKLVKWSEKWQMLFNFGKCKCTHIGHGNMDEEFKMWDAVIGRTTKEKDLGVTFNADMKNFRATWYCCFERKCFLPSQLLPLFCPQASKLQRPLPCLRLCRSS